MKLKQPLTREDLKEIFDKAGDYCEKYYLGCDKDNQFFYKQEVKWMLRDYLDLELTEIKI